MEPVELLVVHDCPSRPSSTPTECIPAFACNGLSVDGWPKRCRFLPIRQAWRCERPCSRMVFRAVAGCFFDVVTAFRGDPSTRCCRAAPQPAGDSASRSRLTRPAASTPQRRSGRRISNIAQRKLFGLTRCFRLTSAVGILTIPMLCAFHADRSDIIDELRTRFFRQGSHPVILWKSNCNDSGTANPGHSSRRNGVERNTLSPSQFRWVATR